MEVAWFRSLQIVREQETCPLCGLPKAICRDKKNERKFSAEAERCFATAAINRQQGTDEKEGMPDPGSLSYTVGYAG